MSVPHPAQPESHSATIGVSARVLAQARLQYLDAVPSVDVTAADISLGQVSTRLPARLRIHSNSRSGYALELLPLSDWFTTVTISGLGYEVVLGSEGGTVVQRWSQPGSIDVALGFRFALAPDLQPGHYALPLQMQVRPLDQ